MRFDWDETKNAANVAKHGVRFERVFELDWTRAQVVEDDRRDYGETRLIVRGPIATRLHIAIYVWRDGRMRIISLRKANRREERSYVTETGHTLGNP